MPKMITAYILSLFPYYGDSIGKLVTNLFHKNKKCQNAYDILTP